MMHRVRVALLFALSLATLSGCGSDGESGSGNIGFETGSENTGSEDTSSMTSATTYFQNLAVTPMSEAQFHAVGVAVRAHALQPGQTSASALGQSDENVIAYLNSMCRGERPLIRVSVLLYPAHVPAFETIFSALPSRCPGISEQTIAYERGAVAKTMAAQQLSLNRLLNLDATSGFCGQLRQNGEITSKVLGLAVQGLHILPEGADDLVEIGVSVMIGYCPQLTGLLTS